MASSSQRSSSPRSQSDTPQNGRRSAAAQRRSGASTSKSRSNSRAKTSSARSGSRSAATKNSRSARSSNLRKTSSNADSGVLEKVTGTVGTAAKKAKAPLVAGGAAAAGLAAGTILSSKLRAHRRPHVLGLPMPRGSELKSGVRQAARAGQWIAGMQADVRAVRAQAEQSRRQSPIEVLLSGLTSRRLPRHD
jgi:hypothetical protein